MTRLLRSAVFNAAFHIITLVVVLGALPLLAAPRGWMMVVTRLWASSVLLALRLCCGIRIRVRGAENLPGHGPALIASKHQSAFDTIVWLTLLPDPAYVLKRELLRVPGFGWHARKAAMIAVDRDAGASAMRHLLRAGRAAADAGRQIVIFPEGTRVAPGERLPYQPGVAALAATTGLPVIPAATDSGRLWGRRAFSKRPGTITVEILPPLATGLPRSELMSRLEAAIETATEALLAEPPADPPMSRCGQ